MCGSGRFRTFTNGCFRPKAEVRELHTFNATPILRMTASAYFLTFDEVANCIRPVTAVETKADVRERVRGFQRTLVFRKTSVAARTKMYRLGMTRWSLIRWSRTLVLLLALSVMFF